jgi:hypothetical protein
MQSSPMNQERYRRGLSTSSNPYLEDPLVMIIMVTVALIGIISLFTLGCIDKFWKLQKKLSR